MNYGTTVFTQMMNFLPLYEFRKCVQRLSGQLQSQTVLGLDQYFMYGFCATNPIGKPPRY